MSPPPTIAAAEPGDTRRVLCARALRAFGDGYAAILLPAHLSAIGFEPLAVGAISTATLLGSSLLALALGAVGYRVRRRPALLAASLLMVGSGLGFTHLPSSVFLILVSFAPNATVAFALLVLRALLSQMDVPTRSSYVMAVVEPHERPAAASITAVPRGLAAAASPLISGWLMGLSAFGWPLILAGTLKVTYDLLLLRAFSKVRPPEEAARRAPHAGLRDTGRR